MRLNEKSVETDVLVIGTGAAGCFAAMKAHDLGARVTLVNKVPWLGGCTMIARAGYSAAMGDSDSKDNADVHALDSLRGGDYMGNEKVLKAAFHKNVEATHELLQWGATFRKKSDGHLDQGKVGVAGHTYPRAVRVAGHTAVAGKFSYRLGGWLQKKGFPPRASRLPVQPSIRPRPVHNFSGRDSRVV